MAIKERAEDAGTEISNENKSVLTDHLGSVVEVLNASGLLAASEQFAAFGERQQAGTAMADLTGRGFTGHTQLESSALVHMGGRVMDSFLGRFLSPDPNIPDAGSTQSFNRFSYVRNNPLSATDPSGFIDIFYGGTISVSWGKRFNIYVPGITKGCKVGSAVGCHGKAGAKSVVDMIFDGLIGPLPSYERADDLVLYVVQPDCGYFSSCDDGESESSWSWGDVFETVVDFTPVRSTSAD